MSFFDLEAALNPVRLGDYLNNLGYFGPVVFVLVMAMAVVISPIPSLPLDLAAGAAFGPILGTLYAVLGAEIGAIMSFLIGRMLGREVISRLLRMNVVFCEKCSDKHLIGLVFLSRLFPVFSFDLISYGAGLTNMSLKAFAVSTFVGMIPPTFALVYFGSGVISIQWPLLLSGALLIMVFLYLPKLMIQHSSASWVRMIQGEAPIAPAQAKTEHPPSDQIGPSCSWCKKRAGTT